jgi:acyl-CoA oxidase
MPPTVPVLGRPCTAIIWAQLVVDGVKKGVRPFIVPLNDGKRMYKGITSKSVNSHFVQRLPLPILTLDPRQLPYRGPTMPVNHSITTFDQVKLPSTALLGEVDTPFTHHQLFLMSIWRIAVGTLSLAMVTVPMMKIASTIAYRYSCRREVGVEGARQSILSFRTQQLPIFYAIATAGVFEAFANWAAPLFSDSRLDMRVRHAIATCAKAILVSNHQSMNLLLSDRCGAQGLFNYNQIIGYHVSLSSIIYHRLTTTSAE